MVALRLVVLSFSLGVGPCGRTPEASSSPVPLAASSTTVAPAAPEPRCDRRERVTEKDQGWPRIDVQELGRRRGGFDVEGTLEDAKPGYDCGGVPSDCDKPRPFEVTVVGQGGARVRVRSSPSERGAWIVPGVRYVLSIVVCADASGDGGAGALELRGAEPAHRVAGAEVACTSGSASAPTGSLAGWPFRALPELERHLVASGGFDTEGFVVRHFVPAPCPPNAVCKPQPPPYVVLGDVAEKPARTLLLETPDPAKLPLRAHVRVSVVVCDRHTFGGDVNEGVLRAFTLR